MYIQSLNTSFVSDTAGAGGSTGLAQSGSTESDLVSTECYWCGEVQEKRKRSKPDKNPEPVCRSARNSGPVSDSSNVGKNI